MRDTVDVGRFPTPPTRLLQALYSLWEWYGSSMGDYPPTNFSAVEGFKSEILMGSWLTSLEPPNSPVVLARWFVEIL